MNYLLPGVMLLLVFVSIGLVIWVNTLDDRIEILRRELFDLKSGVATRWNGEWE